MSPAAGRPVVVVTGAARGGGRGAALALAADAASVVLVARSTADHPNRLLPGTLESVAAELRDAGLDAHWVRADLARPEDCELVVSTVEERFGGCDVLVNNAAYNPIGRFVDAPIRRWRTAMAVNADAAAALTHGFLPGMLARDHGRIVNIGSLAAVAEVGVDQVAYAASKAALERFTTGLAVELQGTGVSVNLLRVDEGIRSEALEAMLPDQPIDPARSHSPEAFGHAVRWIAAQPADFTGNLLGFADLRALGAMEPDPPTAVAGSTPPTSATSSTGGERAG